MNRQSFEVASVHRNRVFLTGLTAATTVLGVWWFQWNVTRDGYGPLDVVLILLFTILFGWCTFSFWSATLGAWRRFRRGCPRAGAQPERSPGGHGNPHPPHRTAVLMPVYNEDPSSVFAGLQATIESIRATRCGQAFDFYVLSDTTNADIALEEETAWAQLKSELPDCQIFYRHRPENRGRKAGNIADFVQRWGVHYEYMLILDADSVMDGETVVEMVRRVDNDPKIGILQAPPMPVNRLSLIARCQQFAARLYSPVFMEGFSLWSHSDGNYWGHNAILRVRPFLQHCGLPVLPGKAPLGGEILSHDFVEAALMLKNKWKVVLAHDLGGSYEECPTTLRDFAKRDQRWCQGNMQHIRLIFTRGFHPLSRIHLAMGVLSYLSAPLWFLFLMVGIVAVAWSPGSTPPAVVDDPAWSGWASLSAAGLFVFTMTLLVLPKLYAFLLLCNDDHLSTRFVSRGQAFWGMIIETVISALIAPIMMLYHSWFAATTFLGMTVRWSAQQRGDTKPPFSDCLVAYAPHFFIGCGMLAAVWLYAPALLIWLAPVYTGLILAAPIAWVLGDVEFGQQLVRWRLLITPEETQVPPLLLRQRELLRMQQQRRQKNPPEQLFANCLLEPAFNLFHRQLLQNTESTRHCQTLTAADCVRRFRQLGPQDFSSAERTELLADPRLLGEVHRTLWTAKSEG